jgi:hypothetical protein
MSKTIVRFLVWFGIAYLLAYPFFGKEIFTPKFIFFIAFVIGTSVLIFNDKNVRSIVELIHKPKKK